MNTKTVSIILGLVFIAVGILGFVSNPVIGTSPDAIFHADQTHNIVHLVSGGLFLLIAFISPGATRTFLIIFGIIYLGLGIYGATTIGANESQELLGFLHVNKADNYLHIGLGAIIFLVGVLRPGTAKA